MRQHIGRADRQGAEEFRRVDSLKDNKYGGECFGEEVEERSLHHPFCTCLYAHRRHSGTGSGVCPANVLRRLCRSAHHVALPCVDIPRGFMSLRFSHLHSAVVLRRHRWSVAPRHTDKGCKLYRRPVRTRHRSVRQDRNPHSRRILR